MQINAHCTSDKKKIQYLLTYTQHFVYMILLKNNFKNNFFGITATQ